MDYQYEATSRGRFLQQLAVAYLRHGYFYYVAGQVPAGKDPEEVDRKLLSRYGIGASRWARARRKQAGGANMHYLRSRSYLLLLSTAGVH